MKILSAFTIPDRRPQVKTKYRPLFKELLDEIRKREANMQKIAMHCAPPSEKATKERPHCTNIQKEIEAFDVVFEDIMDRYKKAIDN